MVAASSAEFPGPTAAVCLTPWSVANDSPGLFRPWARRTRGRHQTV